MNSDKKEMGLFPEASSSVGNTTGASVPSDTSGGGTPNVRRRLFSAASDILAAVGSSKSAGSSGAHKLTDTKTSASSPTKITTSISAATFNDVSCTSSSSMQQLSTSWEFLR